MTYWRGPARWINVALLVLLALLALDALFRLLDADGSSPPAALARLLAAPARAPAAALGAGAPGLLVDLLAALLWILVALLALVAVRSRELAAEHMDVAEAPVTPADVAEAPAEPADVAEATASPEPPP
jgi:hypothetical protein